MSAHRLFDFDHRVRRTPTLHARRVSGHASCKPPPASSMSRAPRPQRGAVALLAAICVSVAIAALGVVDIGHFYYARRDLQRTADLAASAGVQMIGSAGGCPAAMSSAQLNAAANGLPADGAIASTCGRWDPGTGVGPTYFTAGGTPSNALKVIVSRPVSYMFLGGQSRNLTATATAQATSIRAFSLSTSVAALNGGLLNGLLNGLLGSNLNLDVVSYRGLATAQVKLQDLAVALGAGSIRQLLNTRITVAQLATAMVTALSQGNVASATVTGALGTIASASTGSTQINLGDTSTTHGLLAVSLGDPQAAATATVNVLDALLVAAEIAHGQSAINLGTSLNLSPLANITAQARVIRPPVIAVGEAGTYPDGTYRTSAHASQVQLYLNVQLVNVNIGGSGGLPSLVNVSLLNLPIYIEAGSGQANLLSTQCTTQKATSVSSIQVTPGIAQLCVGGDALSNFGNSTVPTTCTQPAALTNVSVPLLSLSVLNVSVVPTPNSTTFNLALQSPQPTTFQFNGVSGDSDDYQTTNTNAVGSAAGGLVGQLATGLAGSIRVSALGIDLTPLAGGLTAALAALLTPILNSLDLLLVPLLQLLGVQIGVSTVHDLGLACGQAQLVY